MALNNWQLYQKNGVLMVNYAGSGGNSPAVDIQYITANSQLLQLK
jgi:hypothetical protein